MFTRHVELAYNIDVSQLEFQNRGPSLACSSLPIKIQKNLIVMFNLNHSDIQTISLAPLQVDYYSETFLTQHEYCAGVSRRSTTGNCECRTCPRSLRGG